MTGKFTLTRDDVIFELARIRESLNFTGEERLDWREIDKRLNAAIESLLDLQILVADTKVIR